MAALLVLAAVLGAAIGSFLNVVIHRLPAGESVISPGSRCPGCGHGVRSRDNVPIVSWLLLRGRCRDCGEPISARYPLVEALTGALFVGVVLRGGLTPQLALDLPFVAVLVAIAFIDLDHRIVPNRLVYPTIVWGVVLTALLLPGELPERLIAGAAAFAFLLTVALIYPRGMGMGDVKLAGAMGVYLGLAVVPALLAAFFVGSVVGIGLIARHGSAARKQAVPFAPFLAIGAVIGLLAGQELIALYANAFLA